MEVTADGEGLVSHAGAVLLVELAERAGLKSALSVALGIDQTVTLGARLPWADAAGCSSDAR